MVAVGWNKRPRLEALLKGLAISAVSDCPGSQVGSAMVPSHVGLPCNSYAQLVMASGLAR